MIKIEVLQPEEIEKIIENAYRVLEEIGVKVSCKEALKIYEEFGCTVEKRMVKIPREVVKKALSTVPEYITIYDRDGNPAMELGGRNSYYGSGPTCTNFMDTKTGERRMSTKQDAADTALVADALENIDFVMSLVTEQDYTPKLADVHEVDAMLRNTTKPIATWANNKENLEEVIDLFAAVKGGRDKLAEKPNVVIYSEPTTPLTHTRDAIEKVMVLAENRVPCLYTPGIIMGGTGPVTMAATLTIGIAEYFTGMVLHQAIAPGAPFIGGVGASPMDMKTMTPPYGAPESYLVESASNEIFRYLHIPNFGLAGATDSVVLDSRAGWESAFSILLSKGTGGNLIHDIGFMDYGLTGSIQHMVMCNEIIGMSNKILQGINMDEDSLAFDLIKEVGPGGQFISNRHTFKHFKKDIWQPKMFDRVDYDGWVRQGSRQMSQIVQEKTEEILANHVPTPLSDEVMAQMDAIVAKAEERIAAKG
ncbi:MAG: trimethylamine methyltransferase family protein [Lachnospiraceae bacterium]|nr:trimethylamine methyltransferase family protein [Candidatus Equihabitans merdae]